MREGQESMHAKSRTRCQPAKLCAERAAKCDYYACTCLQDKKKEKKEKAKPAEASKDAEARIDQLDIR